MNIENELINFLEKNIKDSENKHRNIQIVAYYYGFRGSDWPTLEETGKNFDVGTRERIRQLLNKYFRDYVKKTDLPSVNKFLEIIYSKPFWTTSEFESELVYSGLVNDGFSIKGILNIIEDLKIECEFDIYTPELVKTSRNNLYLYEENFLIKASELKKIKSNLKKAQGLPGRCGIANLEYLKDDLGISYKLISMIIDNSLSSWTKKDDDGFWYIYENRDNTIINYSEKLFSVIGNCDSTRLSKSYRNALDSRTYKYPYPPESIIKEYLESSVFFENENNKLNFIGEFNEPNDIEKDVVSFLTDKGSTSFPEIREHLRSKGYGDPHIQKAVGSSPFVYVDKSDGRTHYKYSLTGSSEKDIINKRSRYHDYLLKLRKLLASGTDETIEQKYRKEQKILQDWLFKDKEQEVCAICGKTYSVRTLVVAHKKKRSECNDAERLDPYVVMPVCLFGCDYLYERRHILIKNGVVIKGASVDHGIAEVELVDKLIGNHIDHRWLKGNSSYFS